MEPSSDSGGRELSGVVVEAVDGRRCRGMTVVACMRMRGVWCDLLFGDKRIVDRGRCAFTWMLDVGDSRCWMGANVRWSCMM